MKIPVNRNNDDPFYRYNMSAIKINVEGKSTGKKTVLLNIIDVSKDLKRNPFLLVKYIGTELGAQTIFTNSIYKISGSFSQTTVQDLIYDFIDIYILCSECLNPETFFHEKEKDLIKECYACGKKNRVSGKLKSAIIKELESNTSSYYVNKDCL